MIAKRRFGRTGPDCSVIAFGGGAVGGLLINAEETMRGAALQRAVAAGINWIDTAPIYGDGESERTIGRHRLLLSPRPHISTKFHITDGDQADIAGAVERSLEQSLKRLQADRVDALQLHNRLGDGVETFGGRERALLPVDILLRRGGVADALERLKADGLIGAAGFTAMGNSAAVLQTADSGRFDSAQIYFNLVNPSAAWSKAPAGWRSQDFSGLMAACKRHNTAMLNVRVFAGGPLAIGAAPERLSVMVQGSDAANEARCAAAVRQALGDRHGSLAQIAMRFVLTEPDFSTHVVGLAELAYLDEAIAAYDKGPLPADALDTLRRLWASDFRDA